MIGRWSRVPDLPFFPVHTHVLPTGEVMIWPGDISGEPPGFQVTTRACGIQQQQP